MPRPFLEAKIAFMPSLYYAEVRVKTVNSNEDYSLYCMIALRKDGTYTFVRHERKNLDLSYNGVLAAVRGAVPEMFNSAHDINDYMALCRQSHVLEFDIGKVDEKIIPKTSGLSNAIVNLQLLSPQYDRSAAGITPSIRQSPVDVKNQKTTTFLWRYLPIVKEASMVSAGDNVFGSSDDIRNCADVIRQTSDQLSSRGNNVMSMVSLSVGEMQQNFSTASALVGKVGDVQKKTATQ
ncbi:MAG: hypothetical protein LBI39_03035 [Puniceicoccales bacterium]|nr:hypothetical protein [Puniceicoccales bacterium]